MKHWIIPILLLCGAWAAGETEAAEEIKAADAPKRPNIILIYTDDHAFQSIGAYGSKVGKTPNLDRLANEGMRFTNCCVTNSICGPMRAVVQTGKYSHANGFIDNRPGTRFDNTQTTFPKLLQAAGYNTAIVGKWHLNCGATPGFDYSEVLIDQGPYFNPAMIRDGKRVQHQGYTTEIITDLALDWLKNGRDPEKPFLLLCQHKATHRSWDPIPKYYDRFKDTVFPLPETFYDDYSTRGTPAHDQNMSIAKTLTRFDLKLDGPRANMTPAQKAVWNEMYAPRLAEFKALKARGASENEMTEWKYQCYMRDYLAVASAVDDSVGEILAYLKEAGLDENTLVIYSSDQGFYLGEHGWFDKRFMYEESYKTAFLARWKGQIAAGSVNSDIVSPLDFAETFLELAGVDIPADMQGASVVPMLFGRPKPADWRTAMFYKYYEFPDHHHVHPHEGLYDGRFKLMHFLDLDEWEFYDLESDPHELRNLIADPEQSVRIDEMKTEMERQKKTLRVP